MADPLRSLVNHVRGLRLLLTGRAVRYTLATRQASPGPRTGAWREISLAPARGCRLPGRGGGCSCPKTQVGPRHGPLAGEAGEGSPFVATA